MQSSKRVQAIKADVTRRVHGKTPARALRLTKKEEDLWWTLLAEEMFRSTRR